MEKNLKNTHFSAVKGTMILASFENKNESWLEAFPKKTLVTQIVIETWRGSGT